MVDLFATECPANCGYCDYTGNGTHCARYGGCNAGYAYKAEDGTCQR